MHIVINGVIWGIFVVYNGNPLIMPIYRSDSQENVNIIYHPYTGYADLGTCTRVIQ